MENAILTFQDLNGAVETNEFCEKHGQYTKKQFQLREGGKVLYSRCPACEAERTAEKEKNSELILKQKKEEKIRRILGESGIPKRFIGRTLNNFRAENDGQKKALMVSRHFAKNFEQQLSSGGSLIFSGKPGTGKTHLAAAIANAVCQQGRTALFLSVLRAVRMVKDTWNKGSDETENRVYRGLIEPDLLILDEVGVQFGSETEKLIIFEILNGRYEQIRPSILISNLLRDEISEFLGERIIDRLREGGGSLITFNWDSYRPSVLGDSELPKAEVSPVVWG